MSQPWLIVRHVAHEGPGLISSALERAGQTWTLSRMDQGDELVDIGQAGGGDPPRWCSGLVVMGGPMSVNDLDAYPWLVTERALIRACVEAGLPVLGVCLGAQQLALALGGEVFTGPEPEIGPGTVEATADGLDDPVTGPAFASGAGWLPCFHWHGDTFSMPPGATRLAGSDRYENQAFRVGDRAYGFQFHVEVDAELAGEWGPRLPDGCTIDRAHQAAVAEVGRGILGRFVRSSQPG